MEHGLYLKIYEQQSIEACVKLLKAVWFNKTSRGGGEQIAGEKRGKQQQAPRMKRVYEVMLRRYAWYSGRLQQFFDLNFKRACDEPSIATVLFPDEPSDSEEEYTPDSESDDEGDFSDDDVDDDDDAETQVAN
jgi:hypothetical protein